MPNIFLDLSLIILTSLIAFLCASPGLLLLHKKKALLAEAVVHSLLPILVINAFLNGIPAEFRILITIVFCFGFSQFSDWLTARFFGQTDSATAVLPALFLSVGLILNQLGNIPLIDTHQLLLGKLELFQLNLMLGDFSDLRALIVWLTLALLFFLFLHIRLRLAINAYHFDETLEYQYKPIVWVRLLFQLYWSITIVIAYETAGILLVPTFFVIIPLASTFLCTRLMNQRRAILFISVIGSILALIINNLSTLSLSLSLCLAFIFVALVLFPYRLLQNKFA